MNGTIRTKAGCGSSSLDTSNWYRIMVSNQSRLSTLNPWKSFANFVESLYIANIHLLNLGLEIHSQPFNTTEKTGFNAVIPQKIGHKS